MNDSKVNYFALEKLATACGEQLIQINFSL